MLQYSPQHILWGQLLCIKCFLLLNFCRHVILFQLHHHHGQWAPLSWLYRWAKRKTESKQNPVHTTLMTNMERYTCTHTRLCLTALSVVAEDEKSKCLSTAVLCPKRFYVLTERNENSFYNEMEWSSRPGSSF